jgi:hypothetical protein
LQNFMVFLFHPTKSPSVWHKCMNYILHVVEHQKQK